jgi:hypothetical protein
MAHSGPCFQIEGADLVVRQSRDRGVDKADIASDLYPLGKGNHRRHPLVLIMEVRPVFNVDFNATVTMAAALSASCDAIQHR